MAVASLVESRSSWEALPDALPLVPLELPFHSVGPSFRSADRWTTPADPRLFPPTAPIFAWLEAAFRPGALTTLHGTPALLDGFLPFLLAAAAANEHEVSLREGANRFSPYAVGAMSRHLGVAPDLTLARIRIARAFTAYQMVTLVDRWAPELATREPPPSLLVASEPGALFGDEAIEPDEAEALCVHVADRLARLARATRLPMLLVEAGLGLPVSQGSPALARPHESLRVTSDRSGVVRLLGERRDSSVELVPLRDGPPPLESFGPGGWDPTGLPGRRGEWAGPYRPSGTR
ncbi:MAG TPA: hypothetical protein VGV64_01800 [Thermoplasmata archaeon]|nr:hypothetical protein [Thermoplasmata archaeon]